MNLPPNWFAWGFISLLEIVFNPSALRAAWPDFLFLETDDKSIDIRGVYQNVAEALDIPEEKLNEWKRSTAGLTNTVEYDNISKDFSVVK